MREKRERGDENIGIIKTQPALQHQVFSLRDWSRSIRIVGKRGDERTLSLYWFVMFVILTIAIVSGVALFYGKPFDVRGAEASVLADALTTCVVQQGHVNAAVFAEGADLEKVCGLTFDDASRSEYRRKGQYYASVSVGGVEVRGGNIDAPYPAFCNHEGSFKNIPVCVKRNLVALDAQGTLTRVDLVAIVAKVEQNG